MNCINCGSQNDEKAKFCANCGAAIQKEAEVVAPAASEEVVAEEPTTENEYMIAPKKKKMGIVAKILIGIGIVLLLGVVAVVAGLHWLVNTPVVALGGAFTNTGIAIVEEVDEVTATMPITAFFEGFETGQYTATAEYEDADIALSMDMEMDIAESLLKMTPNLMGFGADILVSEQYLTVEMAILDDVYGVNLETLSEDLVANGYLQEDEVADDILGDTPEELLAEREESIEALADVFIAVLPEISEMSSVEELDNETLEIGGETITTDAYGVVLDMVATRATLEKLFDEILAEDILVRYINRQLLTGVLSDEIYLEGFDIEDLSDKSYLESKFAEILANFDAASGDLDDVEIVINVYNNRIARIALEHNGDTMELQLGVGEKVLERVTFATTVAGETTEIGFAMAMEDDVFQSALDLNGDICSVYYDFAESADNFVLDAFGTVVVLSVDFSDADIMEITYADEYAEVVFNMEKTELADGWFEQKTEFIEIVKMTEEELQAVVMTVLFGGAF